MRTRVIHLIGALAIILSLFGFGAAVTPSSVPVPAVVMDQVAPDSVSADSPYCSVGVQAPFWQAASIGARQTTSCSGATVVQVQVCLYRNGASLGCASKNGSGTSSLTVSHYRSYAGAGTYQAWGWEYDSRGYTEARWGPAVSL